MKMSKQTEKINAILEKKSEIEKQLASINEELLKTYINQCIEQHALDFKENNVSIPRSIGISFEDVYDDEGGYDTQIDNIMFYDEQADLLNTDYKVEHETFSYEEEFNLYLL